MLPEERTKANVGVGIGVLLQLTGLLLARTGNTTAMLGLVVILVSIPVFIWGCMHYAEGKGHSKWVGLAGLGGVIGLIVLIVLPDQDRDGPPVPPQISKLVALVSMVMGFGLAALGLVLHHIGDDARLERLLYPWPAVCMVLGACLVVGSLPFMVARGRR